MDHWHHARAGERKYREIREALKEGRHHARIYTCWVPDTRAPRARRPGGIQTHARSGKGL